MTQYRTVFPRRAYRGKTVLHICEVVPGRLGGEPRHGKTLCNVYAAAVVESGDMGKPSGATCKRCLAAWRKLAGPGSLPDPQHVMQETVLTYIWDRPEKPSRWTWTDIQGVLRGASRVGHVRVIVSTAGTRRSTSISSIAFDGTWSENGREHSHPWHRLSFNEVTRSDLIVPAPGWVLDLAQKALELAARQNGGS